MSYALTNETRFSSSYLDRQSNICCNEGSTDKFIRFVGCNPGVYRGSDALFAPSDISMCRWFQPVTEYSFQVVQIAAGATAEAIIDAEFMMLRVVWPTKHASGAPALESEKVMELGLNEQAGYVGSTIPFYVGVPDPPQYRNIVIKDLFVANSKSAMSPSIRLVNLSPDLAASVVVFCGK